MITIKEVSDYLESIAPLSFQESYDNAGLIVGDASSEVTGVLIALDCLEEIVDEAVANGCNLIITHHPIIFGGIRKLNGKNYVERTVIKALRNNIAVYAIHTNLDNVSAGVNAKLCDKLGLQDTRILAPRRGWLRKLVTFCPVSHADNVRMALFGAGCGAIGNYDECSFNSAGTGTFRASGSATPFVGEIGKQHHENEIRIETIFASYLESGIITALKASHPYQEVAYDIYPLDNHHPSAGSGMVGELPAEITENDFLQIIKDVLKTGCIRHTRLNGKKVKTVAVCGGSGSFLLNDAIRSGADFFVTSDYKYHQFFDADGKIVIADIGHYESEWFTVELLKEVLVRNFSTFAVRLTELVTNPVHYY